MDNGDQIKKIKAELKEEKALRLMALADFENYRKRVDAEKQQLTQVANMNILREIAELVDDFSRMVSDLEKPGHEDKIDAFKPVLEKAKGILVDYGLEELPVKSGDKFNPETMEAIGTLSAEDNIPGTVLHIAQTGYKYSNTGRILRHARVIVSKK